MPASALGAPLLSRLEPEITADHFGVAVRMACADASAPYTLPLQDQHMFPDDSALPVCLVQRYEHREETDGKKSVKGERGDGSSGSGATAADRRSNTAVGVAKEELIVARISPPISPVWVPARQAAFGRASTLPTNSPSSPLRILPLRTLRAQSTTSVSPVAAAAPRTLRHTRAVSYSPRSRGRSNGSVATLDAATAAAAVAAAVAAAIPTLTDEDHSRSPSPEKKTAAQRAGRFARRGRSKSSSSSELQVSAPEASGGGEAASRGERSWMDKSGRSLSPLMSKGRGFFVPSGKSSSRWRPSIRSPGRKRGARAEKRRGGDNVSTDGNATGDESGRASDGDRRQDHGGGVGAGSMSEGSSGHSNDSLDKTRIAGVAMDGSKPQGAAAAADDDEYADTVIDSQGPVLPPPPPPPLPPSYSTPPTTRRTVKASPLRKSPVASPVRPPLKPMAAEQHQHQGQRPPADSASRSANGEGTKNSWASEGSSLLDGVEQSSDLGAFFRQGEAGQAGGSRRRGRGSSPRRRGVSPRAGRSPRGRLRRSPRRGDFTVDPSEEGGGKDDDDDHDHDEENGEEGDDEEEENGRGAGVGVHVIVLHHGYCGSSMDMRLIKNYIRWGVIFDAFVQNWKRRMGTAPFCLINTCDCFEPEGRCC